jgi:hypothetical protein
MTWAPRGSGDAFWVPRGQRRVETVKQQKVGDLCGSVDKKDMQDCRQEVKTLSLTA